MFRNWMGSDILTEAVRQRIVTEDEADIVIDISVYEQSPEYLAQEHRIPALEVRKIYTMNLRKLRAWFYSGDLNAELLLLRCGWL